MTCARVRVFHPDVFNKPLNQVGRGGQSLVSGEREEKEEEELQEGLDNEYRNCSRHAVK